MLDFISQYYKGYLFDTMELNFCTQCGNLLEYEKIGDEGEQKYCKHCNKFFFDNPASCVLVTIVNENKQVLLLKQNYISTKNYTLCSGYLKKGDTLEDTVVREVSEETGQQVISCEYVQSYYFEPKNIILTGFIASVRTSEFAVSNEVDELMWADLEKASHMVERENNFSGVHLDKCIEILNQSHQFGQATRKYFK